MAATTIVRVADKSPLAVGKVVEDVVAADAVFIGDTHDDKDVHAKQLELLRSLYQQYPKLAIGVEMFTSEGQQQLDEWTSGKMNEKEFVGIYAQNWSYDWSLYRDLFVFARDNRIPMIALNLPKPLMTKIVRQGAKALGENDRKEIPPGDVWTLDPRQAEYMKLIREQVFRGRRAPLRVSNFDEAQALRNHNMAYKIVKFREKSPKSKVVVIAGVWHAIKNGAPASLKEYGKCSYKVILPNLPEFGWMKPTTEDVDYLISAGSELSPAKEAPTLH